MEKDWMLQNKNRTKKKQKMADGGMLEGEKPKQNFVIS